MKNKTSYTILLLLCVVGFWLFENFYTPSTYSDSKSSKDTLNIDLSFLPSSTTNAIISHNYYMLSYNEPFEQAEWVMYELKKSHLTYDDRKRPYFIEDPKVKTKSADWRNYKRSGYDRGHLCPAGDRRFSEYAYNETFYTSNISPQRKDFNAGVWNRLEQQVRQWCKRYGDLYVVTGGVLEDGLEEIGDEDVDVPNAFYKIVFRKSNDKIKIVAFLFPHRETQEPLANFLVSIDQIETKTGIDFFHDMPKEAQRNLERKVLKKDWNF
ncbi:DNA/RNA non-specific endonuclease [Croceitalea sp. MTPC9]|uniref:DNA/RNA non-specific endonuclease n=1 Tax=unclassified Croceitalea TaxID=2632280 RepID=UPI002B3912BD|nr:DNA/RNA non-specific endonuclease [Croceitalea sp. MTPC6]GMN17064.1 DNA/RNA non-specific endonuclease [Croceitalea sp. MTPC9]